MKSFEELRLAALIRAQDFCNNHSADLATITEYPPQKAALDDAIIKITTARAINIENLSHIAVNKEEVQTQLIDLIFMYMLRAAVKAHEIPDVNLEASLSFPKTYLSINDDATVGVRAEEIKNIIKTNLTALTNIPPADITLMEDAILAYNNVLLAPKEAIDNRKATGTDIIPILLNQADIPKNMIGKLITSYLSSLVNGWEVAIRVGTPSGTRHTSIIIRCFDAEAMVPVINVNITFSKDGAPFTKTSNKLGYVRCYSMEVGTWSATTDNSIYQSINLDNIPVNDKKVLRYDLKLIKKNPLKTGGFNFTIVSLYDGKKLPAINLKLMSSGKTYITDQMGVVFDTDVVVNTYEATIFHNTIVTKNISVTITENNTTQMIIPVDDNP